MPLEKNVTVNGFSWNRTIMVEEERTVEESDWSVPIGGRVYDERQEIYTYEPVLVDYETVVETKSREVIDHYDTSYTYTDNGNVTFTENEIKTPVYRTEYYTETHEEPVYEQKPVYKTKYYYEIKRWFDLKEYSSNGTDKEPYWNENYTLTENQRDTDRRESYYIYYDDGSKDKTSYNEWLSTDIGDGYYVKYNRLGITYSRTAIE